jgi:TetR/AcrR family fatty acid metabolism transcriptional regulator
MQKNKPRPSLRERQRQERATLILQAAEEVLSEKGYHDTSMDEIAARVGIAKGTIYQHFPSKEALIVALFERNARLLEQAIERIMQQELPARTRLEHLLHYVYQERREQHRMLQLVYQNAEIQQILLGGQPGHLDDCWPHITAQMRKMLEDGKAEGAFDRTISTELMLHLFMDLLTFGGYEPLTATLGPDELLTQVKRVFFEGISSRNLSQETLAEQP